ncbi:MAG: signal peptidase I [Ruminococcus sp.]|nr:signal peptidase I [Ruminococcus sp.]MBR2284616.1 signal peptidase I [Ruminococcus sp.]
MADSLKTALTAILKRLWKLIQHIVSFLTTLFILAAMTVATLFLLKIKPYVVTTGSMEPAIPVSSICFVDENIPLASIEVGEVISFRLGDDILVTHRVTAIDHGEYTTKGDANNTEDAAPVTSENYLGKTVFVLPKLGVILIFLHSGRGKIAAVTLIILLFILSFLPKKEQQKPQPESDVPTPIDKTK